MKRRDREPTVLDGVEQRLSAFARLGGAPGTETAARLLERLGRPQDRLKFVHVAGTNGKGSTAAMIAAGLTAAGCRTGLFVSFVADPDHRSVTIAFLVGERKFLNGCV